jgi:hypothetical protein
MRTTCIHLDNIELTDLPGTIANVDEVAFVVDSE